MKRTAEPLRPARTVAPGAILRRELEERGWSQKDLAEITGRPEQALSEIIRGKKEITPETALDFARAFGTSAELWMNLQSAWQLHQARAGDWRDDIERRSRIYSIAPVAEITRRGWLRGGATLDQLEAEVCRFLGIRSLTDQPEFGARLRHSAERGPELSAQVAWLRRVESLAAGSSVSHFSRKGLEAGLRDLLPLARRSEGVAMVPDVLGGLGVRFVVVPHLSRTFLDGATFLREGAPIVAVTLRYDRIDSFWFTLMHELAHVFLGHEGISLDTTGTEAAGEPVSRDEAQANRMAKAWLIPEDAWQAFAGTGERRFPAQKVGAFAESIGRHPGLVVGRLHHEERLPFSHLRGLLVKVSPFLASRIDRAA